MSRYTRTPVSTLQGINNELAKVELAMQDTLDRKGVTPNFMDANLDMNSRRILNLPAPLTDQEPLRRGDVPTGLSVSAQYVDDKVADAFALKIFQSPTDGGLTEIQTRAVNNGEVYQVRKVVDNSLATIYGDKDRTIEIDQSGVDNTSNKDGINFFIDDGEYYITVESKRSDFKVKSNQGKVKLSYFGFREDETINGSDFLKAIQYAADKKITIEDSGTYTVEFTTVGNADLFRLIGMPTINVVGWDNCSINLLNNGALYANFVTSELATNTLVSTAFVDTVSISTDVKFIGDDTGATRASKFARIRARCVNGGKLSATGFTTPYIFDSRPNEVCEICSVLNASFKNTQTGLYLSGDGNLPSAIDDSGWFENVQVDKLSIINTAQQQGNYTSIAGSDGLLIEGYKRLNVGEIYSERAIERALYANTGYGPVNVDSYTLQNSSGVKVVGYVNHDVTPNIDVIVKNVRIGAGTTIGGSGASHDSYGRAVILYDAEGVVVSKVHMKGSFTGVNNYMESAVLLQRYLKDVTIDGVVGRNIRNAPVIIDQAATLGVNSKMEDITIQGISVVNPSIAANRHLIHVEQPDTTTISNLRLLNNYGKSTTEYGINEEDFNVSGYKNISRLLGLINIDYCAGLTMEGNVVDGYSQSVSSDRTIGASCTSIKITDYIVVPTIGFLDDLTIRASNGSEILYKAYLTSNNGSYTVKVSPIRLSDNIAPTRLDLKSRANLEGYLTLGSQGEQIYPVDTTNNIVCSGRVDGENGEFIEFVFDGVALIKTAGTANFLATNTNGSHCLYQTVEGFILRNRTATAVSYNITFKYSRWEL